MEYRRIAPGTGHREGRALLEQMYVRQTGLAMPPIRIGSRGKPYFADGRFHFSISHTERHVFCVLADHPVGLDAEEMDRRIDLRVAEKILSPDERAQYDNAADQRLALLTFWVLKEAQGKCTGQGINGYPNHTHFSLTDPRVQIIDGCVVALIEEETYHAV